MADRRSFFKLTTEYPDHPKVIEVGGDAGWLNVCAIAYCARTATDGLINTSMIARLSDRENPLDLASKLLDVGLWHIRGHSCQTCVQPPIGYVVVHDYLEHQTSAEQMEEISAKRAIAGRKGGQAKAAASKLPSKLLSKSVAEVEVEVEVEELLNTSVNGSAVDQVKSSGEAEQKPQRRRGAGRPMDDENFARFWKIYPRKVSKGNAERAWKKAIAYADPALILAAVEFHAMECKLKDPQYVPHAATWLNGRRWEDEPDPTYSPLSVPSEAARANPTKSVADIYAELDAKL